METLYLTHPACRLHRMGAGHPECPERLDAINDQLLASGLLPLLAERAAPPARREDIERVHDRAFVDALQRLSPADGLAAIDPDTAMNSHTLQAARHAAGAGIAAVDAIMAGEARTAFCAVRPPGHHAGRDRAMGFCFYNNVAIAAQHAMDRYGVKRLAIVDFDVHHGNGTESIFAGDDRVLMCGFFQHPFFPNCGTGQVAANMLNIPVPAYTSGAAVRELVLDRWLPSLRRHAPELLLVSAGFDAHREDDLGQLGLIEADYAWMTDRILEVAEESAGGRVISMLEGGYNLSALGRSVAAHVKALAKL